MSVLALFSVGGLLLFLLWTALAAMSFWIWTATKAKASLLTMIGAVLLALPYLLLILSVYENYEILYIAGAALVVSGYYLTVKPTVDSKIQALRHAKKPA